MDSPIHQRVSPETPLSPVDSRHGRPATTPDGRFFRFDSADEDLAGEIQRRLIATGRRQLGKLRVSVNQGRVQLSGTVDSYYAKQVANHAALSIDGIVHLESQITVE